jgi:F420-non-reducing hydrogenase small subunit
MTGKKEKIKIAICRGCTCSGCDIAILDIHERLLKVIEKAQIVYAPTIMDTKNADVEKMKDGEIDVCFYHGAVRDSDNEELAHLLRKKSKIMIAFGACACFGGIFGLANTTDKKGIFAEVYKNTPTTDNPKDVLPQTRYTDDIGHTVTLPEFYDSVYPLDEKVDVDYYIPLCPPTADQIMTGLNAITSGHLPPKGTIIASDKTLCSECERKRSQVRKIGKIHRPHEIMIDQEKCMLDQGLLCMGPATRAGCGTICIKANVPCRGCGGPTKAEYDQGANILGLIATIYGIPEESLTEEDVKKVLKEIKDPLGTFYRFTLPKSILKRKRMEGK